MMQEPSPQWNKPATAAATPQSRRVLLGNVSLALAILDLLYCLYRLLMPFLSRSIVGFQREMMASTSGPNMSEMMDVAQKFADRIAPWEALRTVPFIIASAVLLWIAIRLRRGDGEALRTARTWAFGAFGAVAISLLIQVLVIVPATLDYQHEVMGMMLKTMPAGRSGSPVDVGAIAGSITLASTVVGVVMSTLGLLIWPVALLIWTGRLTRETPPPAA